ncbi:MAG: sulfite exporter TauE/SafE family protein [Marmoricola sp.]
MSPFEIVAILLAGMAAGTINTVVGSGTLITFPTLLAFGIPPVTANVSNTIGLVPGSVSGVIGYRAELAGQRARLVRLVSASLVGGITGALLLLSLPSAAFDAIVPVLILLGCALVILGPRISKRVAARAEATGGLPEHGVWWVWPAVALAGVYGGYFGAAQGVLLMAILGIGVVDSMQRHNATKNVLALVVNAVAAAVFVLLAFVDVPFLPESASSSIDWAVVGLIAVGSVIGGQLGATVGRRLPPVVLRGVIVVVGLVAVVSFVFPL